MLLFYLTVNKTPLISPSDPPLPDFDPIQNLIQYWKTFRCEMVSIMEAFSKVSKTSENV